MDPNMTSGFVAASAVSLVIGFAAGRLTAPSGKPKRNRKGRSSNGKGRPQAPQRIKAPRGKSGKKPGQGIELYVGNLSYNMREKELIQAFAHAGEVLSSRIIRNKFNGKSKGYGFVEMASKDDAKSASSKMNGTELNGRKIVVNEARSKSRD